MNFDLALLDTQGPMEKGANMEVLNPITNQIARLPDGSAVYIRLLGSDSNKVRDKEREMMDTRTEKSQRGKQRFLAHEIEADNNEILVAATTGWNLAELDGEPFPYSEENARRLWNDPRFVKIREQARQFMANVSNFVKA